MLESAVLSVPGLKVFMKSATSSQADDDEQDEQVEIEFGNLVIDIFKGGNPFECRI